MAEIGQINAGVMSKFLDKLDVEIGKSDELFMEVQGGTLHTGLVNDSQILLAYGTMTTTLEDAQIPVSHFSKLKSAISTFKGDVGVAVEDRLILQGKNTKKIPLTKWDIKGQKIQQRIESETSDKLPITINKEEIDILSQDISIFEKISEVFITVQSKTMTITMKDEVGFESVTTIPDIQLEDGNYILPTIVFKIMKKADNIELYLCDDFVYFRDKADQYEIKYLVRTKE